MKYVHESQQRIDFLISAVWSAMSSNFMTPCGFPLSPPSYILASPAYLAGGFGSHFFYGGFTLSYSRFSLASPREYESLLYLLVGRRE